jgi:hypothetical protein
MTPIMINKFSHAAMRAALFFPRRGWWLGALLLMALSGVSLNARADHEKAISEYGLKAVLFFKLPQFVYWPNRGNVQGNLVMCVLGGNPFERTLELLAREPVNGRKVEIVKFYAVDDNALCEFVFISRSEGDHVEDSLRKFAGKRIVTVSDIPGFAKAGGMVELTMSGEHVGMAINRKAAQKQGLEFSAQLLSLAKVVAP